MIDLLVLVAVLGIFAGGPFLIVRTALAVFALAPSQRLLRIQLATEQIRMRGERDRRCMLLLTTEDEIRTINEEMGEVGTQKQMLRYSPFLRDFVPVEEKEKGDAIPVPAHRVEVMPLEKWRT